MPVFNIDKADFKDCKEHPVPDDVYQIEKY